jgi:hypothetical protein
MISAYSIESLRLEQDIITEVKEPKGAEEKNDPIAREQYTPFKPSRLCYYLEQFTKIF